LIILFKSFLLVKSELKKRIKKREPYKLDDSPYWYFVSGTNMYPDELGLSWWISFYSG